jgi:hypothetical protein
MTWRRAIAAVLALVLVAAAGLAVLMLVDTLDERPDASSLLEVPLSLTALALAVATIVRGALLRADLASPVPRHLLFGEIPGGAFGARLAFLLGLPSSMWNVAALAQPAFWLLLLARPIVYLGLAALLKSGVGAGLVVIAAGHACFAVGKRLAARIQWRADPQDGAACVLFLRSFEDDQLDLHMRSRNPLRWLLNLWSFRRNLDEALVDEVSRYAPVVALGRPGEKVAPFGAARHYASHDDWREVIVRTARRAQAIVIAAGDTPGVLWEYAMLEREGLLAKTLLVFPPGGSATTNREALAAFPIAAEVRLRVIAAVDRETSSNRRWIALLWQADGAVLLTADRVDPSTYVLALRLHFQARSARELRDAASIAPNPLLLRPL